MADLESRAGSELAAEVDRTNVSRIEEIEERNILSLLEQVREIDAADAKSDEVIAQCRAVIQSHQQAKKARAVDKRVLNSKYKILNRARLELHLASRA